MRCGSVVFLMLAGALADIAGVMPDDQHRYVPDADGLFACLSDPTIKIPFDRVNDNYCDCPDGSDEPGTAACPNGRFWCAGSGQYIPARLVGDGVCDYDVCCDGSDEAPGTCVDRCAEVRAKQAAEREAQRAYVAEGARLRGELVEQAATRKRELERSISDFERSIPELERKVVAAEADLANAVEYDATSGADEESVRALGALREALHDAETVHDQFVDQFFALKDAYLELDAALETMSTEYNPNFNDPAVKDAIKKWRAAPKPELGLPSSRNFRADMDLLDQVKVAGADASGAGWARLLPAPLRSALFARDNSGRGSGPRAQAAQEHLDTLRATLEEAHSVQKLNKNLLTLGTDFWGADEVGRSSENLCVSKRKGDFDYEACLFGTSVQVDGQYTVQLGRSTGLKKTDAGHSIEFVDGDVCPNGVNRSTTMVLLCGHATEALSVEEPETCHYLIRVKSPLACEPPASDDDVTHDEL